MTQLAKVSRPQFLIGVRGLFAFGAQWARLSGAPFSWELLVAGWLAVAAAQLSVHFNNDYFDARLDRPGSSTFISGGSGVLAEHPELKRPSQKCDHQGNRDINQQASFVHRCTL